ncbi:kinesin heavy chain-like [Littorina saxatilis]|uniref:kinesin heavy chain-like n=1 Tax=Littorina saxatilis TaxID=31220 RepID=UPI0038B498A9
MSHIKTFARLKPADELYDDFDIKSRKVLSLRVPELVRDYGAVASKNRSSTISYDFQYDRVLDTKVNQDEVYNVAAKEIVSGFLDGYNGTIFAYGQTGTGKTYTVEGGARRYSDRGLAPRALAEIYKSLEQRENEDISLHISYLEIYQEVAYDLLSTSARTASPVTVFPKVNVMEGANGTCMIRNLSMHLSPSEDVAHALLLQGQANRKVAETPVNMRSSRSHAVFTIYLSVKKQGTDLITRSKLHLVDLAGSERVAKTGVDGQQLTEAKCINLSLHYLETVIIALQADNRPRSTTSGSRTNSSFGGGDAVRRHVPYRNSLLTMVLRDSLGGNCLTSMVATISLEVHNLGETLSTCRFAQRVACISNHARRNEEIDDKTLIRQLKRRVAELEAEMACLRLSQMAEGQREELEEDTSSKLTDEDKLSCAQVVQEYLAGRVADPVTAGISNPYKFRECLRILKRMVMNKYFHDKLGNGPSQASNSNQANYHTAHTAGAHGGALNDRGATQLHGNSQVLRLDDAPSTAENHNTTPAPAAVNGAADTDDLILSIQKLYAASRRVCSFSDQTRVAREGTPPDNYNTTPPRTAPRPDTYKSPFERKREKEIRKLSRKVDTLKLTQSAQELQLQDLRTSTAYEELSTTESIVRNKIQVTREQIADQHAYRLHLRHTEASPEILQQEKMVEDQLIKREAKFQKKLDEVVQKKAEIEAEVTQGEVSEDKDGGEGQGQAKGAEKRSLEEQFAQYKKRNGTLNTRQVFDMLKSEEKKRTKETQQTEEEKKYLMSKQLAMKEEATREKLRDLKEMLRKSREEAILGHPPAPGDYGNAPAHAFNGGVENGVMFSLSPGGYPMSGAWTEKDTEVTDLERKASDQTLVAGKAIHANLEDLETSMTRSDDGERNQTETYTGKTAVGSNAGQRQQNLSSDTPSRTSTKADLKWDSAYSRPSTSQSSRPQDTGEPGHRTNHAGSLSTNHVRSRENSTSSSLAVTSAEERNDGRVSAGSTSSWQSCEVKSVSPVPSLTLPQENGDGSEVVMDLDERNQHHRGDCTSEDNGEGKRESYSQTVMPSEYVRGMDSRDKFDARKMGLSSKTFDSALSSMLNDDFKPVAYNSQFYDQYAREPKPLVKKAAYRVSERRTTSMSHPSPERRHAAPAQIAVDHSRKFASSWGPEAKNSSVAKRLAQFLSDDNSSKTTPPPRPETTSSSRTAKSVSFVERLTQLQTEDEVRPGDMGITADMGMTSPRIQALKDPQREMTYMERIQAERERVAKIRKAREAAEAIQQAWRHHCRSSK